MCIAQPECVVLIAVIILGASLAEELNSGKPPFGPNNELVKALRNIGNDIVFGPSSSNDLVGKDGWLRKRFGQ
jgi:hypothetical protein